MKAMKAMNPLSALKRFQEKAKKKLDDKSSLRGIIEQATAKLAAHKEAFKSSYEDIGRLFRLVKNWSKGRYRKVNYKSLVVIMAATLYFLNPFDFIPDFLAGFGFVDDFAVLTYVIRTLKRELADFATWEKKQGHTK